MEKFGRRAEALWIMDERWRIELFGGLNVRHGERQWQWFRSQKGGALLAYLAYHASSFHSREVLAEVLWPEQEQAVARNRLRATLTLLRNDLDHPHDLLIAHRSGIGLNSAAVTTDVLEFESGLRAALQLTGAKGAESREARQRLQGVLELYRGPLLVGFYENWISAQEQRCEELYTNGVLALIEAYTAAGEQAEAIATARRGVEQVPLREELHAALVQGYLRSGHPAAALRQFRELERLLKTHLGTSPSPATCALMKQAAIHISGDAAPPTVVPRSVEQPSVRKDSTAPGLGSGSRPHGEATDDEITADVISSTSNAGFFLQGIRLPVPHTRFWGRQTEVAQLCQLLQPSPFTNGCPPAGARSDTTGSHKRDARLWTLLGCGGSGKTRLALEVAWQVVQAWHGRVFWVDLTSLTDGGSLAEVVLENLPRPARPQVSASDQIVDFLREQPALLLLDNFEQLVPQGTKVVSEWLDRVPFLTIVITSRRRLNCAGEREFLVPPLPIAPKVLCSQSPSTSGLGNHSEAFIPLAEQPAAVQLFVDRAQSARTGFKFTGDNATAINALCRRLDGLPLPIELAAARSAVLTPQQMLTRLDPGLGAAGFAWMKSRHLDGAERHRTLQAMLEWSCRLLSPSLRDCFYALSVFRGGFEAEAVQAVYVPGTASSHGILDISTLSETLETDGIDTDVLDWLSQLRDCGLVVEAEHSGQMRFRLLETVREFAQEQLSPPRREAIGVRHAHHFKLLAGAAAPEMEGPYQVAWTARLETEHDNLRAAFEWYLEHDAESALAMVDALTTFWSRSFPQQARRAIQRVLEHEESAATPARARALMAAASLCTEDSGRAREWLQQSRVLFERYGSRNDIAWTWLEEGRVDWCDGEAVSGRVWLQKSLALFREMDDLNGMGRALGRLSDLERSQNNVEAARDYGLQSLEMLRECGNLTGVAAAWVSLGELAQNQDEPARAQECFEHGVERYREIGHRRGLSYALHNLAVVQRDEGHWSTARALLEESLQIGRELENGRNVAWNLTSLGEVARLEGNFDAARRCYEQALQLRRDLNDTRNIGWLLHNLAFVALEHNDTETASKYFRRAVEQFLQLKSSREQGLVSCLAGLGAVAAHKQDWTRAAQHLGAARTFGAQHQVTIYAVDRPLFENALAQTRRALDHKFEGAQQMSAGLSLEAALAAALPTNS